MFIDSFVDVRGSIGDRSNFEENLTLTRQQFAKRQDCRFERKKYNKSAS